LDAEGHLVASTDLSVKTTHALASRVEKVAQVPVRDIVTYELLDQPAARFAGFMGMSMVMVPLLGILLVVVLLMFSC
jgi:hypothetical protein